jgi:hypothetical protein
MREPDLPTARLDGPAPRSEAVVRSPAPYGGLQAVTAGHRIHQRHSQSQLNLEQYGGHTPAGVWVRVLQRILALTAAIWHNDCTGQPVKRSLLAYNH